jgi:hypothetical protein
MDDDDFDYREKLVLKEFETRPVLRYCDLPSGVGHMTMARLVKRGLVRVVERPKEKRKPVHQMWERLK